jgi:hypothetical protein
MYLQQRGAMVTRYQDGLPPPDPGQINVMVVAQSNVMQHGLEGAGLPLNRHLVRGMHVLNDLFMAKLMVAQGGQVRR